MHLLHLLLPVLAIATPAAAARPLVIEPSATIESPESAWPALDGALATNGEHLFVRAENTSNFMEIREAALHFRRVGGQWQYQGVLDQAAEDYEGWYNPRSFAMQGNLAVVHFVRRSGVWRNVGGTWQNVGTLPTDSEDIEIDGEGIVSSTGSCSWNARAHDPDRAGGWVSTLLQGPYRGCDDDYYGGEVDRLGNIIVIGSEYPGEVNDPHEAYVYERTSAGWERRAGLIASRHREFTGAVGLLARDDSVDAIVGGRVGNFVFDLATTTRSPHRLLAPDAYAVERRLPVDRNSPNQTIEFGGGLIFIREGSADRDGQGVINVYRGDRTAGYELVAVLAPPMGVQLNKPFRVAQAADGLIAMALGGNVMYEFRIPADLTTPAPLFIDFEDASTASWTPVMGTFQVIRGGTNRFYRQLYATGDARALLDDTNWFNQAIEADITPRDFNGADRWAGLVTRYRDAQNYYYLTLRSSGSVQLRRMAGGQFVELASAPVNVALGRPYKLRLQSIGTVHRVYLNGELVLDVDDATLLEPGQTGIAMYKTVADFDNVVASPAPYYTIFRSDFSNAGCTNCIQEEWTFGGGQWVPGGGVLSQTSTDGEARAVIGAPVEDQVVRARIRPVAYRAPQGTQERWSGLIARHTDDGNYYYVTLRSSNNLSLRKLVDGQIIELASQPYTFNLGTTYDVKLEAVGDHLRVHVNGQQRLQVHDSSHTRGAGGLMTWKTSAQFDDYVAYQP